MNKEQLSRYLTEFIKSSGSGLPPLKLTAIKNPKDWAPPMKKSAASLPPRCAAIALIGEPAAFLLGMEPDDEFLDDVEEEEGNDVIPPQFIVHDHNTIVGYSRMVYIRRGARQWELLSIEQGDMAAEGEMFALPLRGY